MPIYEFRCHTCGHRFEKLCPLGEGGEHQVCPACRATGAERVMSSFASPGNRDAGGSPGSGSSCSGCSGGSCATCGH
ncbi:putative regulatory protein, FmdB family [Desulfofundulus australicus DSM 11792]|uniref:Putative regulatory protein, FmdB family n=1 Tax=Desulfofundulus australicus DSM 11792 TaxID=1121425 RepID=A0A1M5A1I1_9FIRM|nr:zinc ribbon domain-containing protein [Desulfofundulus australicus]SHF24153.1 putative regulatory protein, FmdB family [Desulfofundulus australicus DSM 11792]